MTRGADLAQAHRDLRWLIGATPDLLEARRTGTARYWLGATSRTVRRRVVDVVDPDVSVHGKPAPLHLDVFDALTALSGWAASTAPLLDRRWARRIARDPRPGRVTTPRRDQVSESCTLGSGGWPDPRPALTHIRVNLTPRTPTDLATQIATDAHYHAQTTARILGLITDGQTLAAACPHCHYPDVLRVVDTHDGTLIVCTSGVCRVEDTDRTGRNSHRGKVAWRYPDGWVRLARMLEE